MDTKIWQFSADTLDTALLDVQEAASLLKNNEVVAFPTETVYGLGGNALSDEAIDKIYQAKGRPGDNPLIVHIAERKELYDLCTQVTPAAEKLIKAFWPGPLTVILPSNGRVSAKVTAGLSTIAVRMPEHPLALALISAAERPIAAPSANTSGRPSPTSAAHVIRDLNSKIAGIVDGGTTGVGLESTVVDATVEPITILRPGGITREEIEAVIGKVSIDPALLDEKEKPKAPGMKYTHYAPQAPLYLVSGGVSSINREVQKAHRDDKKVGVITVEEHLQEITGADILLSCGTLKDPATIARQLYEVLRKFDETDADIIFCETFSKEGIGDAIMNRLQKASGGRLIN
jgi:L-threonylcarbamoyladenylate synthase